MATTERMQTGTPTSADIERYKRQIYEEWQSQAIVAAYRKWNEHEVAWGSALSDVMVEHASVAPGMRVLDLASGHGEPALALARAVAPGGHVTATDQGPALLRIAEERAAQMGLANIAFQVADAHALPFADASFERVTSRLGLMYFLELDRALAEVRRVLVPGGRATFMVWGSFEQPLFEALTGPIFSRIGMPEPEPGAPNPFVFAKEGSVSAALRAAGFTDIEERRLTVPTTFPGTPAEYWAWFWEMIPPMQPLLAGLEPAVYEQIVEESTAALRSYVVGSDVIVPVEVIVASAATPPE